MRTAPATHEATGRGPLERLRDLRDEGLLAVRYDTVAGLLTDLAGGEDEWRRLARAGHLLCRVPADEVLRHHPETDVVTVAVAGHGTVADVVPPLTAELARHGMLLRSRLGDFGRYLAELEQPDSVLYAPGTDLALCLLDPQIILGKLVAPWRPADVRTIADDVAGTLSALVRRYAADGPGTLVCNTVPLPREYGHQLLDQRSRAELGIIWREFNCGLLRLAVEHPSVVVLDLDPIVASGVPVADVRLAQYVKAYLGEDLLSRYAREVGHLARALRGRTRKVLVLDLDNTLWDGVLGDDGYDGVCAAGTIRGAAFGAFQRVVRQLAGQGVLLAVSSKNDREPACRVLRDHPDMVLRERDFVHLAVDWSGKDEQLREIARKLEFGLDSMVFVDDSAFECGLVAAALPEVTVVRLDDEPASHVQRLLADGWFDTPEVTDDDRARTARYQAESARRLSRDRATTAENYLSGLDTMVSLHRARDHELGRIAQLTMRTNQFNLTTRRMPVEEVRAYAATPGRLVVAVNARDRFGDNGLVGVVFAGLDGAGTLCLDNVLLSCRVFGRGIEHATVAAVLAYAAGTGARRAVARYRPTPRNGRFREFYPALGFRRLGANPDGADPDGADPDEVRFLRDLTDPPDVPGHIRLTVDLGGRTEC